MIFAILILIFLGAIVFFHYISGFFSATISAILCVIAAVIAFSYHESLANLFGGRAADYSNSISILAIFGVTYLIMRIPFDKAIPGNIRVPLALDKVGAVVMGLIAGIFATGVMAVAAAELPFGADIAGFTRFDTEAENQIKVETKGKTFYSKTFSELRDNTPGKFVGDAHGVPIVPVDNILVGMVSKLSSETGSLQNNKPLEDVHPHFLTEAFGQRLGIEPSATHVSVNLRSANIEQVKVLGLFAIDKGVLQDDGDNVRKTKLTDVKLTGSEVFVAVRVMFTSTAGDSDSYVRFSPGSVRFVLHDPEGAADEQFEDYYPIGTMEGTGRIFLNKMDDYLFCKQGNGADFVFVLPKKLVDPQVKDGSFIEVKRDARIDLSGMKVESRLLPNADIAVIRKDVVLHPDISGGAPLRPVPSSSDATPTPAAPSAQPAAAPASTAKPSSTGLKVDDFKATKEIPVNISLPPGADNNALLATPGGGTAKLQGGKIKNVKMDASSLELKTGDKMIDFAVPQGQSMIQVKIVPSGTPSAAWGFATDPEQYEIVDSTGKHYQPNGVVAIYRGVNGERVKMIYSDTQSISGVAAPDGAEAPTEVYILYNVPTNTTVTEFDERGQKAKTGSVVAK